MKDVRLTLGQNIFYLAYVIWGLGSIAILVRL
jgi:hypothetical protein